MLKFAAVPSALVLLTVLLSSCGSQTTVPSAVDTSSSLTDQSLNSSTADAWRQQVIYLALPDRFSNGNTANDNAGAANCFDPANPNKFHGGDLAGVQNKLSYIQDLGATAVWLTPVYTQVGVVGTSCGYHGYWPNYTNPANTNVEPKLGSNADLTNLINTLHSSTYNMKFVMDMVVNHAGYNAAIASSNPSWFHSDCQGNDILCPLAGLPDFRQEDPAVATYLTNASKAWVSAFPIDSIRMDTIKHVPLSYWQNSWVPGVNAARAGMFLFGEAFLDSNASQLKPFLDAGFDSTFNFPMRKALVDSIGTAGSLNILASSVQDTVSTLGIDRALLQVTLLDNHDVPRFLNAPGMGVPEVEIRRRYNMSMVALMSLPGIPQIYYGNELGVYGGNDPDNRKDMPSWAWTDAGRNSTQSGYLGSGNPKTTFDFVKKLIGVRKANPGLWKGGYAEMWRPNGGANVYAFYRGSGTNRFIVVMNNGTIPSGNIPLNIGANTGIPAADRTAMSNATFSDQAGYCAAATITSSGGTLNVNLPGQCAAIYKL